MTINFVILKVQLPLAMHSLVLEVDQSALMMYSVVVERHHCFSATLTQITTAITLKMLEYGA